MLLSSCVTGQVAHEVTNFNVSSFSDSTTNIIHKIKCQDSLQLNIPDGIISFQVRDADICDTVIYVLDNQNNIVSYSMSTGNPLMTINKRGHGHEEYLEPRAICSSKESVFVLDCQGNVIIEYDKELSYKRKIKLGFSALDFRKTKNGFILYNLNANDRVKQIVFVDDDGSIKKSIDVDRQSLVNAANDKVFVRTDYGTYIIASSSNTLYEVEDYNVNPLITISSDNNSGVDIHMLNSFIMQNYIITLYNSTGFVMSNVYDKRSLKSESGLVDTHIQYPFTPLLVKDNQLYGIYPQKDLENKYVLVVYRL